MLLRRGLALKLQARWTWSFVAGERLGLQWCRFSHCIAAWKTDQMACHISNVLRTICQPSRVRLHSVRH
ncbi:hypothetical protein PC119_g17594 [Phytophthora cactorum]|uniref:Uncharacterized protein n=1 Tax=Phytophthora cactorum TaxID=29920 RepID=A0A8T1BHK3_9STRA|nr:hypothetical protein PC113_g16920 [Phytophthora cactorum]KAG2900296.1 hypothetical protein PC115_g16260 [Phytophthora cactorum]KAG2997756.1 hypothetical protein PC119_g17594 [Phytophthora cactorum]KAG3069316.1 hypothetical protein PC122_g16602 [Phytophthora cactorum]